MKILRVRRGFTTNSSSANEWMPSPSGTPPKANPGGNSLPGTPVVGMVSEGQVVGAVPSIDLAVSGALLAGVGLFVGFIYVLERLFGRIGKNMRRRRH